MKGTQRGLSPKPSPFGGSSTHGRIPNRIGSAFQGTKGTAANKEVEINNTFKTTTASIRSDNTMINNYEENWHPTEKEIFFGDAMEKTAAAMRPAGPGIGGSFARGMAATAGGMFVAGLATGIQRMMQKNEDRENMMRYEQSLRTAIQMSPTLQRHSFNELRAYLPMIAKASPTVAAEPRLLANYLETMIDAEGNLNLATFGELASLENNLLRNQASRNELSNAVIIEGVKGIAKETGSGMSKHIFR